MTLHPEPPIAAPVKAPLRTMTGGGTITTGAIASGGNSRGGVIGALNRLLQLHCRSLAEYVAASDPWSSPDPRSTAAVAKETLQQIVAEHRTLSDRFADAVISRRGRVDPGQFPMVFTDTNMLSLDYMLLELVAYQREMIPAIEQCALDLNADHTAHVLAEGALHNARGHLAQLERLTKASPPLGGTLPQPKSN